MSDDDWPQEDPARDEDPDAARVRVYTGEVMLRLPDGGDRRSEAPRYDEEVIADAIRLCVAGFKVSEIAAKFGCSRQTVYRWWQNAVTDRQVANNPDAVAKARATVALELEVAREQAWQIVRSYPGTKLALDALVQVNNLIRNQAVLQGLNAPAVVHVDTRGATAVDVELQEMISEARAKSSTDLERIRQDFDARQGRDPQGGAR